MRTILLVLMHFHLHCLRIFQIEGKLPNLSKYSESGRYSRFSVTNPAQSEVSWTNIATGLNPGGHGIFDFVHRDPGSYTPYVSLLPTKTSFVGTQFTYPFTANTIFDEAVRQGFSATALWWPARFPARSESLVRTLPWNSGYTRAHGGRNIFFGGFRCCCCTRQARWGSAYQSRKKIALQVL